MEHGYLDAWRRYRRVLGQRNAALKKGAPAVGARDVDRWRLREAGDARSIEAARPMSPSLAPELAERGHGVARSAADARLRTRMAGGASRSSMRLRRPRAAIVCSAIPKSDRIGPTSRSSSTGTECMTRRRADSRSSRPRRWFSLRRPCSAGRAAAARCWSMIQPRSSTARHSSGCCVALDTVGAQLILTGLTPAQLPPRKGSAVFHVERGEVRAL